MNPNNHDELDDVVIDIDGSEPQMEPAPVMTTILTNDSRQDQPVMNNDSETQPQDVKELIFDKLGVKNSKNPLICIFHMLFKACAIFSFIFGGIFFNSVFIFIIVSVMTVFDFWVVKNISGRYLVGLRWWTSLDEKGKEKWIFESFDTEIKVDAIDYYFFWYGQLGNTLFWMALFCLKVLTFSVFWGLLCGISLSLSAINLYAFYKCNKDYQNKFKSAMGNAIIGQFVKKFGF